MVVFDPGVFEIAVCTYNRAAFVEEWLSHCFRPAMDRNIKISIYDSSSNEDTKQLIERINYGNSQSVEYHRIDSKTIIGYKPMIPILNSNSKFLWISGDSRYHDFSELDEKLFPFVKNDSIDYAALYIVNNKENGGRIYTDNSQMLNDFFISSTCIGLSIYRLSIFNSLKNETRLIARLDSLFRHNYAFAWLGYFYTIYAQNSNRSLFVDAKLFQIQPDKKVQSWAKRFYGCWANDMLSIIDNLPDTYKNKKEVPKETWKAMNLDSIQYCYCARKTGDLNKEKYRELISDGSLKRLTDKTNRIRFYATAPLLFVELSFFVQRVLRVFR